MALKKLIGVDTFPAMLEECLDAETLAETLMCVGRECDAAQTDWQQEMDCQTSEAQDAADEAYERGWQRLFDHAEYSRDEAGNLDEYSFVTDPARDLKNEIRVQLITIRLAGQHFGGRWAFGEVK